MRPGQVPPVPESIATYCRPSIRYVIGDAFKPELVWYDQSASPVLSSYARSCPLGSPEKTRPPAVTSNPPNCGDWRCFFQTVLPVARSTASMLPCSGFCGKYSLPPP